jgi:hypothetical protein
MTNRISILNVASRGCRTTPVAHVHDSQILIVYAMVDKIGIASGRQHTNPGNVGRTSETRISRQQASG